MNEKKTLYPFLTKRQIAERLAEPEFLIACLAVLHARYLDRISGRAKSGGWMSSHEAVATKLVEKIKADDATPGDVDRARKLVSRYLKQLAAHYRAEALASDPSLAATAAVYGITPTGEGTAPTPRLATRPATTKAPGKPAKPGKAAPNATTAKGKAAKPGPTSKPTGRPREGT